MVLRNLSWPGFVAAASSGRFTNIYVGYGIRSGIKSFNPISFTVTLKNRTISQDY